MQEKSIDSNRFSQLEFKISLINQTILRLVEETQMDSNSEKSFKQVN